MTERPILFSAPMIRALLAGAKTQTRRVIKPCPFATIATSAGRAWEGGVGGHGGLVFRGPDGTTSVPARCRYGSVGDRLWVKETWAAKNPVSQILAYRADGRSGAWFGDGGGERFFLHHGWVLGAADNNAQGKWYGLAKYGGRWRPSIHMPRWASRITLEITEVRAQRLHDIDDGDARAEGMPPDGPIDALINGEPGKVAFFDARTAYAHLWDTINGTGSWKSNPLVWAITFRRVDGGKPTDDFIDETFAKAGAVAREVRESLSTGGVKLKGQGGR